MPTLILGVSGSIAAYRAADLARDLMRSGFDVRVCLTDGAQRFVSTSLFEALTGNPCLIDTFEEPEAGRMAHIDWARKADILLIAPATANTINRIAYGFADDMLTTLALAYDGPIVIAPAMYANGNTQEALERLATQGAFIVEPVEGDVACGETGQGKLAANLRIAEAALEIQVRSTSLSGKRVLITSGPTREPIDTVRFLSNRSTGKMGSALARAALLMGAQVDVVTGPVTVPLPSKANVVRVETAAEMLEAASPLAPKADIVIGCAAVADYRPEVEFEGKLRRSGEPFSLNLVPNPDIIATLAGLTKGITIGFAAEPSSDASYAVEKISRKGLNAIALNDVSRDDVGFGTDVNELRLVFADGRDESSGKRTKLACALWLLGQL